jgi:hypothetical protein
VSAVGLDATKEENKTIHEELLPEIKIEAHQADRLEFVDPYLITRQIAVDHVFCTTGDFTDRWLDI